jgi:outer membrane lipoprotein LolB
MRLSLPRNYTLLLVAFLAACSSTPRFPGAKSDPDRAYQSRLTGLTERSDWSLEGRLAVNHEADGGSGAFRWDRRGDGDWMDFHGALGRGAWRLSADRNGAELVLADGTAYRGSTVDELLSRQFGLDMPVSELVWWVRGLAAPGEVEAMVLSESGLPSVIRQSGWLIEFERYRDTGGIELPGKISAGKDDSRVKLVIRTWSLASGAGADD